MPSSAHDTTTAPASGGMEPSARFAAVFAVLIAFNLSAMMVTIANVILPTLATDLGVTPSEAIWVITIYQIVVVALLLPLSALADQIGYRPIYLGGLILFGVGCAVAGLSETFLQLLLGRALQGAGAAAIQSVYVYSMAMIYPRDQVGRGVALGTMTSQVCIMLAPSTAALILLVGAWQWTFLLAVPLSLAALAVSATVMPKSGGAGGRFDWRASLVNMAGFTALLLGIDGLLRRDGKLAWALLIGLGAGLLLLLLRMQRRSCMPLIPTDLFRLQAFGLTMMTTLLGFGAANVLLVALPFLLQDYLGLNPQQTGLLITVYPIFTAAAGFLSGWLSSLGTPGRLGAAGLGLLAIGLGGLGLLLVSAPSVWGVALCLAVCGTGFGIFVTPNVKAVIMIAPQDRSGAASGMQATSRFFGQTLGAILVAVALGAQGGAHGMISLGLAAVLALAGALTSIRRRIAAP